MGISGGVGQERLFSMIVPGTIVEFYNCLRLDAFLLSAWLDEEDVFEK